MSIEAKNQLKELLQQLKPEELKEILTTLVPKKIKKGKWSQEEMKFLEEFYEENGCEYCAEQLERSPKSVEEKWKNLQTTPSRPNEFLNYRPNSTEQKILDRDKKADKVLSQNRADRITRQPSLIQAKCRSCGDTFKVSKALAPNPRRFRCNNCIVGR